MCALDFKERGRLSDSTVVTTTMTNLGFHKAMNNAGINVVVTDVGDRYVIDKMREKGYNIGGEQSGHIIFMDYVTTGDGIITALHVLKLMLNKQKPISVLADCMKEFPQLLTNIDVKEKIPVDEIPSLKEVIDDCNYALGTNGRVIVRYSGTENKIRILVESSKKKDVETWSAKIAEAVKKVLC
jgi:phosphoglucosamine mutase